MRRNERRDRTDIELFDIHALHAQRSHGPNAIRERGTLDGEPLSSHWRARELFSRMR